MDYKNGSTCISCTNGFRLFQPPAKRLFLNWSRYFRHCPMRNWSWRLKEHHKISFGLVKPLQTSYLVLNVS